MISIIIPVYKVEKYICGCINSIVNQTNNDFEVILVDDGTPDDSANIAEKMLRKAVDVKWRIIHTKNRGVSSARNTGLEAAVGEYIIMVDADDILAPCFLEDFNNCVEKHPTNDIYSCGFSVVNESNATFFLNSEPHSNLSVLSREKAIKAFERRRIKFLLPAIMFRRNFIVENRIRFDEQVRYSEDVQYIWKCLFFNKKNVIHLDKRNYNYVFHDNSTMSSSGAEKIRSGFDGLVRLEEEVRDEITEGDLQRITCLMYFSLLHGASKMLDFRRFLKLFQEENCRNKMKLTFDSDIRYLIGSTLLKFNLKLGYLVLRKF